MRATSITKLAARSFGKNLPRYRALLLSLVIVVFLLTLVLALSQGMISTLRGKAGRYFAGDVSLQVYARRGTPITFDPAPLHSALEGLPDSVRAVNMRTVYHGDEAVLHFAGQSLRQRRLIGVDWDLERSELEKMDFQAGTLPSGDDEFAVLISTATAEILGARLDDLILIQLETTAGQLNTVNVQVRGIFAESSFFGYAAYLDRKTLNRSMAIPDTYVAEIGFVVDDAEAQLPLARMLVERAVQLDAMQVFPAITSRAQRDSLLDPRRTEPWIAVMTLDAQLSEVKDLMDALSISAALILIVFVILIIIGVSNTFRMLAFERTVEVGTMRALGMEKSAVGLMFVIESAVLGLTAAIVGSLFSLVFLELSRTLVYVSGTGWSELLLEGGRISWSLGINEFGVIILVSVAAGILGSIMPSLRAAALPPVEALQQSK